MMMEDETEVFKSDNPSDNLRKISSEAQKRKSTPAKGTYNPSTVGVLEQLASTSPRSNSGKWINRTPMDRTVRSVPLLDGLKLGLNGYGIHDKDFKQHVRKAISKVVCLAIFQNYQIRFNLQLFTRKVFNTIVILALRYVVTLVSLRNTC